jgi:hypothetical protein
MRLSRKPHSPHGSLYDDGCVALDEAELTLRRYYFPLATAKRIPYHRIQSITERPIGPLTGKGRVWGSGDLRHWAPLDLRRPGKSTALVLDVGGWFLPSLTPEDPQRVLSIVRERING